MTAAAPVQLRCALRLQLLYVGPMESMQRMRFALSGSSKAPIVAVQMHGLGLWQPKQEARGAQGSLVWLGVPEVRKLPHLAARFPVYVPVVGYFLCVIGCSAPRHYYGNRPRSPKYVDPNWDLSAMTMSLHTVAPRQMYR